MAMEAVASLSDDDEPGDPGVNADNQLSIDDLVRPADWPEDKNWGTLTIDASCTPADITYPTDLKFLNEARESTESIIDNLCEQSLGLRKHRARMIETEHAPTFSVLRSRRNHAAARSKLQYTASSTICGGILMPSMS